MAGFLRENWIWIVAPIVVVGALVLAALVLAGDGASFDYTIF